MNTSLKRYLSGLFASFKNINILFLVFFILSLSTSTAFAQQYRTESDVCTDVGKPASGCASLGGNPSGPTQNDCNGTYNLDPSKPRDPSKFFPAFAPSNFGDQNCEFTANKFVNAKNNLYTWIHQVDPGYEYQWFSVIVANESSYDPNAYLKASTSGKGAYGLIQMNPNGQGNNKYDAGDVYWQDQIQNGVNYNNIYLNASGTKGGYCPPIGTNCPSNLPTTWCYWQTAHSFVCTPK